MKIQIKGTVALNGEIEIAGLELLAPSFRTRSTHHQVCHTGYPNAGPLSSAEARALIDVLEYVAANENIRANTISDVVAAHFEVTKATDLPREKFPAAISFMIDLTREEDD